MRQIFNAYPWIHGKEPERLQFLYRRIGQFVRIPRSTPLKLGGEENKLFFLEKGLAAYYVAGDVFSHPTILSLIIPGRTMGDITVTTRERCNVVTKTLTDCELIQVPPTRFREEVLRDPTLMELVAINQIHKQESHLEGMIANFTLEPAMRLKVFLRSILAAHEIELKADTMNEIPILLNNERIGEVVNLTRVSVSRIFSQWIAERLLEKDNRHLFVHGALFEDIFDWHAPLTRHRRR